jgi:hypothetical protein
MIYMHNFFPKVTSLQLKQLQQWTSLRQEQLSEAIAITNDSIVNFMKRQVEKGNWREVEEILKGKPLTTTGKFLYKELRGRVVSNLMLRLGLRRVVALAIALVLVPFIIAKLAGTLINKIKGQRSE